MPRPQAHSICRVLLRDDRGDRATLRRSPRAALGRHRPRPRCHQRAAAAGRPRRGRVVCAAEDRVRCPPGRAGRAHGGCAARPAAAAGHGPAGVGPTPIRTTGWCSPGRTAKRCRRTWRPSGSWSCARSPGFAGCGCTTCGTARRRCGWRLAWTSGSSARSSGTRRSASPPTRTATCSTGGPRGRGAGRRAGAAGSPATGGLPSGSRS
jgi:hypothetical protein